MDYVLVTGANKGIGLAVVEGLLQEQPRLGVILGSRDRERGEAARRTLLSRSPGSDARLEVLTIDVASDASVERARSAFAQLGGDRPPALHGLVNNAGAGDGDLAAVLEVNVHGIRRVCDAFSSFIVPGGRIVNVTSAAGPNFVATCEPARQQFFLNPQITPQELEALMADCVEGGAERFATLGMGSTSPYGFSKACANSYTLWLAKQHPQLRVNACTPGFIETDLGTAFLGNRTPAEAGMKSPAEGARVILSLLVDENIGSGHYFGSDGLRSPMDRYRAPGEPEYHGE